MTTLNRPLLGALALAAACLPAHAVLLTTGTWSGADVILESPDYKVFQFDPFDLALTVDSTPLVPGQDPIAFSARLTLSDTVFFTDQTTWTYTLTSEDPARNFTASGRLGEGATQLGFDGRHQISLFDPLSWWGESFLSAEVDEQVRWDFHNIFIDGDTQVGFVIDDGWITGATAYGTSVTVIDPPRPPAAVPEPSSLPLMLAGLGAIGLGLASRARASRTRAGAAGAVR